MDRGTFATRDKIEITSTVVLPCSSIIVIKNQELELLINMISEAISKDKYLIHYGHCI